MNNPGKILVTGATGFIGSVLTRTLLAQGYSVRITGQSPPPNLLVLGAEWHAMADLEEEPDWTEALDGVSSVVHLAGLAHQTTKNEKCLPERFNRINHIGTRSLAEAIRNNRSIDRFLFVSSIAVHGTPSRFPLRAEDPFAPATDYGRSKADAELAIRSILSDSHCLWGIFRPVLVYGQGNPGNMARLEALICKGVPVPVSRKPNRRSFLFVDNLASAIISFLTSETPPRGRAWIVADRQTCSTKDLIDFMGQAMNLRPITIPLPTPILAITSLIGDFLSNLGVTVPWTTEVRQKLLDDFFVDSQPIQQDLNWVPPYTVAEGIALSHPNKTKKQQPGNF